MKKPPPGVSPGILNAFQIQHVGTLMTGRSGIVPYLRSSPTSMLTPTQPPRVMIPRSR
jgi:hypothetical protein